uniref:Uncharacterized protein n=1 Tax=Panagrolaimus superbus TaxID=310955 RepID=A0A914YHQ9_9BILA
MFRMAIKMKAELEDAKLKNAELIEYNQKLQDINLHQSNTIREEMVKNVEKEAEIVRLNGNITILQARIADCISTNNQLKKDADIERERINEMVKENVQLKAVMEDDKQKNFIVKDLEYRYNQWKGDGIKLSFEHLAFQVGVKESFFCTEFVFIYS